MFDRAYQESRLLVDFRPGAYGLEEAKIQHEAAVKRGLAEAHGWRYVLVRGGMLPRQDQVDELLGRTGRGAEQSGSQSGEDLGRGSAEGMGRSDVQGGVGREPEQQGQSVGENVSLGEVSEAEVFGESKGAPTAQEWLKQLHERRRKLKTRDGGQGPDEPQEPGPLSDPLPEEGR